MSECLSKVPPKSLNHRVSINCTQLEPPTYEAIIRYPRDIAIDLNHWIYHQDKHVGIHTWYG